MKGQVSPPGFIDQQGQTVAVNDRRDRDQITTHTVIGWADNQHTLSLRMGRQRRRHRQRRHPMGNAQTLVKIGLNKNRGCPRKNHPRNRRLVTVAGQQNHIARIANGHDQRFNTTG